MDRPPAPAVDHAVELVLRQLGHELAGGVGAVLDAVAAGVSWSARSLCLGSAG